jgi:hypothetical protein
MRRLLIVLGSIFLAAIVLIGIGIGYVAIRGSALDHDSKAYVDAVVPVIVDGWNEDALKERASPELRHAVTDTELDRLFRTLSSKIGKYKKYNGSKGQSIMSMTSQNGRQTAANYQASVEFETGPATIDIGLIKHGDQWQIARFRVDSKAFLNQ